jgi:alpha/beta hydrolase family protein
VRTYRRRGLACVLDEHGNELGGVRSTYLDVPTASYFANAAAPGGESLCDGPDALGAQERFSRETLDSLYGTHGRYVSRVVRRANELAREGWLLPADARAVRQEAAADHEENT